jgi:hypothetical protein
MDIFPPAGSIAIIVHQLDHIGPLQRVQRLLSPARLGDILERAHRFRPSVRPVGLQIKLDELVAIIRKIKRLVPALGLALRFNRINALAHQHEQALCLLAGRQCRPRAAMNSDRLASRRASVHPVLQHIGLHTLGRDPEPKAPETGIPGVDIPARKWSGRLDGADGNCLIGHDTTLSHVIAT